MITETENLQERSEDRATFTWSLLVSGFVNLMLWMLIAWTMHQRMQALQAMQDMQERPEEAYIIESSSIRHAHHAVPVPMQPSRPQQQQQQQPKPEPRHEQPRPQAQPTEIAREEPTAPPQPRSAPKKTQQATLAEQLAQQEVAFRHEAEQLNAQRAPLSAATIDPSERAASTQRFQMDIPGLPGQPRRGEGIIEPIRQWPVRGGFCYMAHYAFTYPSGSVEEDDIPWPMCFPRWSDPFLRGERVMPMPPPVTGYRLPAGVTLKPLEAETYNAWLSTQ
ncbi:MAG TPA: hypothetical protein VMA98_01215 [Candidatus Acidoferrales bacterium]|nr:hypothetical protein [Candidatus Acidoferrales bacterium]